MAVTYTYSIQHDFNGILYLDQLQDDILANSNITITLTSIYSIGDAVYIIFASDLGSELTYLNTIISSYVPKIIPTLSGPYIDPGTNLINYQIGSNTYNYLGNQSNEIHISTESQAHYNSISAAILDNNVSNRVFIVHPGTYVENNPLTLPNGCKLISMGHAENTFVIAQNPTATILNLGLQTIASGITFQGATSGTGIYFDGSLSGGLGKFSAILECFFYDCNIAIESNGNNGSGAIDSLYVREIVIEPATTNLSKGIYCHSRGLVTGLGASIAGIPGYFTITNAMYCSDPTSKIALATTSLWYCDTGLYMDNGADSEFALLTCKNTNIGIVIGPNGSTTRLSVNSVQINFSTTYDISIEATYASIEVHAGTLNNFIINNPNNVSFNSKYHIIRYGKTYQAFNGDVLFGTVNSGSKLYMGQGYFNIDGMSILSNDNLTTGTWVNNTNAALTLIPPSFNMFQNTSPNNCLFICYPTSILGVEIDILTPTTSVTNVYDIVWEYWNGTTWIQINIMQTNSCSPFTNLSNNFVSYTGIFHIRFGLTTSSPIAQTTFNSLTGYWVRFRIVNALSSIPVVEFVKVHPNSTIINTDGYMEYFGDSRVTQVLPVSILSSVNSNTSPANQSLFISSDIGVNYTTNVFSSGVLTRLGLIVNIPRNMDTSFPLKLSLMFIGDSGTSGNVSWTIRWAFTNSTSNVYHLITSAPTSAPGESNIVQSSTVTTIDTTIKQNFLLQFTTLSSNVLTDDINLCWISIERNAAPSNTNDTYSGNISLIDIKAFYIIWSNGGHILLY